MRSRVSAGRAVRWIPAVSLWWLALAVGCGGRPDGTSTTAAESGVAETYPHYAEAAVRVERDDMTVYDGDTFEVHGRVIRILGLDTPEMRVPEHGFYEAQPYGGEATEKAREIFDAAEVIEYVPHDLDQYGRTLAHVFVDGELYPVKMIEAGLAYETVSFYGDNGFPDLAREIQQAADRAGKPPFQPPHEWRRENRRPALP